MLMLMLMLILILMLIIVIESEIGSLRKQSLAVIGYLLSGSFKL